MATKKKQQISKASAPSGTGATKGSDAGCDAKGTRKGPDAGDWSGLCGEEFWTEDADYAKCDRAKGHPGECYGRLIEEPSAP